MGSKCMSVCFVFYIVLSLLTHIAELVVNGMLAYMLSISVATQDNWFSLVTGVLLIPLVLVQLLSAILLLTRRGDTLTTCDAIMMAFLHILQLGFIWRHFTVLRERNVLLKKAEMAELFLLRMTYGFASGFPLMLIQVYLILQTNITIPVTWILYAAAGASLLSTTWSLASFRRQHETCDTENIILTWPGSVFRLSWRAGEIAARVISLALFATLYTHWLFLVIGLHWVTMLVCVCTSVFSAINESNGSKAYKVSFRVLIAYMYIFSFINFSHQNSLFRYVMFYIIMFMENATLCLIWMLQSTREPGFRYLLVFITATCFFIAVVSLTIYYRFFHVSISDVPSEAKSLVCVKEGCINCKLSLCVKHKLTLQRPFSAGWYSQYSDAVYNGHYYKNLLQDSMLDSVSDMDVKSVRSTFIKPGTISEESNTSFIRDPDHMDMEKRSVVSFHSAGTYSHKRYFHGDMTDILDDDIQSDASSVPASLLARRFDDQVMSESSLSAYSPRWIAPPGRSASQTCLLTDNWDSVSQLNSDDQNHYPSLPSCRSLMRDDHHWYSDGYTTDNTLEWSKLPVTDLSKSRPVVSDSESEYYCHCAKTGKKLKMSAHHTLRSRPQRHESLSMSVKEKYVNWSRKNPGFNIQVTDLSGTRSQTRSKSASRTASRHGNHNKKVPAWALESDSHIAEKFKDLNKRRSSCPSPVENVKHLPPLFDICDHIIQESYRNRTQQRCEDSPRDGYHCMGSKNEVGTQGHYVKSKHRRRHSAGRYLVPTDSESETQPSVRTQRSRKSGPSPAVPNSRMSRSYDPKDTRDSRISGEVKKQKQGQLEVQTSEQLNSQEKGLILERDSDSLGVRNIRAVQKDRNKWSTDSGVGHPEYENDYVPMMRFVKSDSQMKEENVYENQAYIGDSDEVFVDRVVKRMTETPWYVCSESEDSAFPQETFSSSQTGLTNSDNESDDSLELII